MEYYILSLTHGCDFLGLHCNSFTELLIKKCQLGGTQYPTALMGHWVDRRATGKYYLPVVKEFPYCNPKKTEEYLSDMAASIAVIG